MGCPRNDFTYFVILDLIKPALHRMVFRACPVLDTGESSFFNLDSSWSLPRWENYPN